MKCALTIFAGLLAASAFAQFSGSWHQVAGGGCMIANSEYTINATIGQHDAGVPLTGGDYSLTGGFWHMVRQTPGAPTLRMLFTTTNTVVLAWPASPTGFHLERKASLAAAGWSPVTNIVNVMNSENQVTISAHKDFAFYRLVYP